MALPPSRLLRLSSIGSMAIKQSRQRMSSNTTKAIVSPVAYCASLVKQYDYENYLVGLLIPSEHRGVYFTIRAFNVEIALIKDQANSNQQACRMRFNWWRGVLEEIYRWAYLLLLAAWLRCQDRSSGVDIYYPGPIYLTLTITYSSLFSC